MVAGSGYKVTENNQSQGTLQNWSTLNKTSNSHAGSSINNTHKNMEIKICEISQKEQKITNCGL